MILSKIMKLTLKPIAKKMIIFQNDNENLANIIFFSTKGLFHLKVVLRHLIANWND